MQLDFDYFSMVLAGVVRAVTDDQIVIDQAVSETTPKNLGKSILRNRYNTQVLSQLVYLGQYLGSSSAQAVGLLEAFEKALASLNPEEHKVSIDRNKPLVDVLADKNVLIAILIMVLCLMKLENLKNKNYFISLRRRGSYVSIKLKGSKVTGEVGYRKDLSDFINTIMVPFGGSLDWVINQGERVVFIRLHLSSQMPLRYNE